MGQYCHLFASVASYLLMQSINESAMKKKKTKNQTIKNLHLDKPTSHGGWPSGKPGGYTDPDTPVYKQISNYLKAMGLIDDDNPRGKLAEAKIRNIVRKFLLEKYN
tara:strand:+ start:98 stop:415 length:318 start_codon:yes stop_codon:yes gene_type:complete